MLEGPPLMLPVFTGKEKVSGRVTVHVPPGKKMEHLGIKVELKGIVGTWFCWERVQIRPHCQCRWYDYRVLYLPRVPAELFYDRGNFHEFVNVPIQLAPPGELRSTEVSVLTNPQVDAPWLWVFARFSSRSRSTLSLRAPLTSLLSRTTV
jgi:hypothetical protein